MAEEQEDDNKPVRITQKEIYAAVTRVEKEIIALSSLKEDVQDHESRLRELEKKVWQSSWISGLISAVVTSAATATIIQMLAQRP
jgi:hypothetical protein